MLEAVFRLSHKEDMTMHRSANASRPGSNGFTLLELIVVITIIGILGTIVTIKVVPLLFVAKSTTALANAQKIQTAASTLYTMTGNWPSALEELENPRAKDGTSLPGLGEIPNDPWGRDYVYELGENGPVVKCLGRDGQEGGEGEDADIVWPGRKKP